MRPKRIAVLTTGRQDYGILHTLCRVLHEAPDFALLLIVGGMHLSLPFGQTIREIEADGLPICEKVETLPSSDSRVAAAQSAGLMTLLMAGVLERQQPDLLMLVGDRYETLAAALAATLMKVPIGHLHGGEESEGAIDNGMRHALTKLSHLHFVSNTLHAQRILQMGENPDRVFVVGAPGLDAIRKMSFLTRTEIEAEFGFPLTPPILVVTYHPTTLTESSSQEEINTVLDALSGFDGSVVFTLPNADPENGPIREAVLQFVHDHPKAHAFEALGAQRYWSLLRHANVMLGNSSSGLIETPLFELPTINVGERQKGRLRGANVIDVPVDTRAISEALHCALSPSFVASLRGMESPYGDGSATARIMALLRPLSLSTALLRKRFHMCTDMAWDLQALSASIAPLQV